MKKYFLLYIFNHDTFIYAFDKFNDLEDFLKIYVDYEDRIYIESKFLTQEEIKKLHITYVNEKKEL